METKTPSMNMLQMAVGRSWWLILLFGVVAVLFGIMAVVNPVGAGMSITWAIGVLAIADGVVGLIALFSKDAPASKGWMFLYAVLSLIFGVMAVLNPLSMAEAMVWVSAIWFVFFGVMRIVFAIRVRKQIDNEWMLILSGLLGVLLGVMMLVAPWAGLIVGVIWIGVGALIYGVLQIVAAFNIRKLTQTATEI